MKAKRVAALTMAVLMAATILPGCGKGKSGSAGGTQTSALANEAKDEDDLLNPVGELPIVKKPVTLTIFASGNGEYSWEDNKETKEIEKATGIKIKWQVAASADNIKDKLSTMFASKKMTDLIFTGVGDSRYDKASEAQLGKQGLVLPLNDFIKNDSKNFKQRLDDIDGLKDYITTPDGDIYSIPNVDGTLQVQFPNKLWINTKWLDNLGLKMPTTTDELYTVLKAFKDKDANGNGDATDEIALSADMTQQYDGFLMDPFQLSPGKDKLYIDDGKVTYAPVQDKYKDGLKYLNKLYEDGLFNPESFTQDMTNQVNINEAGKDCVIGAFLATRPGYACDLTTMPNSKKWEQYQCVPTLAGPDGNKVSSWDAYSQFQTGMTFITSTCKYPKVAFRLLDYLLSDDMTNRSALGIKDRNWRDAKDGETTINGEKASYSRITTDDVNNTWGQMACLMRTKDYVESESMPKDPYADDVVPLQGRQLVMQAGAVEMEKNKQPLESVMPDLYMSSKQADEVALLKTNIADTYKDNLIQFITGKKDIDKEWSGYKKNLESVGLSKYIKILQDAYDVSGLNK